MLCAQKLTYASLIYRTESKAKKWNKGKVKSKKTDMLRSIGKQSGESVESVPRICRKGRLDCPVYSGSPYCSSRREFVKAVLRWTYCAR